MNTSLRSESFHAVGEQIAASLRDAHLALESFAEEGSGPRDLQRCAELLHSVRGALSIVAIHGASLLSEEMEATCTFLLERAQEGEPTDEGIEALTRAMVQLPIYVERIMDGGSDIPLAVLPLLNDLRAARQQRLLSETTLLLLNGGELQVPASAQPQPNGVDIVAQLPKLRPQFQLALLGWIKGTDPDKNLQRMSEVMRHLEDAAANSELYRLWWVVGGVLEALREQALESSVALKRLLGQTDREIKRLQREGEDAFTEQPPAELINNLLFYVARAEPAGERCQAIRVAFNLSEMAGGAAQVEALRESLAAPSPRLMKTVADAIREDLARAKDVLDIYVRTGREDATELEAQVSLLRKIGDTLGVLGLGGLRDTVMQHSTELEQLVAAHDAPGAAELDEGRLIALAAALLEVEAALESQLVNLVSPAAETDPAEPPPDAEFQAVSEALLGECLVNLAHVKESISDVLELHDDETASRRGLDGLAEQLRGVNAGLMMLGRARAVELLTRIGTAIRDNLQGDIIQRDPARLNRLADAIVSVEYYIETLRAGRKEPAYMLDNAERSLDVLAEAEAAPVVADTAESGSYSQTLRISTEDLPQKVATPEAYEKTRVISAPVMDAGAEPPDLELLETFIEEAREEIAAISRHLPIWTDNQDDEEALITVRRSFHTLKGSGRMVGAQLIGEYAWNVESLLNKVISGTVSAGPELLTFMADAAGALPQLLEQLETGSEPDIDVEALAAAATAFAEGIVPDGYQLPVAAGPTDAEAGTADGEPEPEEPGVDPVLLGILSRETAGHLASVREYLDASAADGAGVSEAMHHACHTLHGSMTMANVTAMAGLTDALNQFVEQLFRHQYGMNANQREMCRAATDAIELLMAHLEDSAVAAPDTRDLEERLQQQAAQVAEEVAAESADTESPVGVATEWETADDAQSADLLDAEQLVADDASVATDEPAPAAVAEPDAAPPAAGSDAAPVAEVSPEFDAEIAEIFAEEATEILEDADRALQLLGADSRDADALAKLQRHLHTLKGGARMAGIPTMGDFSHELESLLIRINQTGGSADCDVLALLQTSVDELHRMREQVVSGLVPAAAAEIMARVHAASAATMMMPALDQPAAEPQPEHESAAAEDVPEMTDETAAADVPLHVPEPEQLGELARDLIQGRAPEQPEALPDAVPEALGAGQAPDAGARKDMARVDSAMLETLLNNAGEISIAHSRLKQQTATTQFNLQELGQTVQRLQQQLRLLEIETEAQILFKHQNDASSTDEQFDPLELDRYSTIQQLSRALSETANDVSSLKDVLQNIAADTETILSQQQRVAADVQDTLMRTRMVPFEQHVPRLQRLVRQQAQESGKQVELVVRGSSGELDRQVMEKMLAPFEHMLRNAVVHGIEPPAERAERGKPAVATIAITFRRQGSHVLIDVSDDGAGLDLDSVRAKALAQGVITPEQELNAEELAQLILRSGLSTADKLTQSAGRGIGMDVVVNEVSQLGGTLAIVTEPGQGCTFTVRLPYTLAISQAFIVRVGAESFALPLPTVEGVVRISRDEYEERMAADEPALEYGGRRYSLRHLGLYLGLGPARLTHDQDRVSIILVEAGDNSAALITDETTDAREIVIKPIGAQLAGIPGVAGATILGDGRIVIILDAGALVRMPVPEVTMEDLLHDEEDDLPPLALVVDDSITMRRVTQRLLERNGMRVLTAKDGLEALDVLADHRPKIILLDVEMPRMDGYEFASRVRGNSATAELPIIMVTSRSGEKHRARAIEIGVNDYLGKPYQEHEMLDAIRGLLGDQFTDVGRDAQDRAVEQTDS